MCTQSRQAAEEESPARPPRRPPEGRRWSSARAHLGLASDPLTDLAPARQRIDDWRAFLDQGLDPDDHAALRAAERTGRFTRTSPQCLAPERAAGHVPFFARIRSFLQTLSVLYIYALAPNGAVLEERILENYHDDFTFVSSACGNQSPFSAAAGSQPQADQVGPFELRLLAAINILRSDAWGSNLQRHLSNMLGRDVAIGQLYLALGKLERKGFISSTQRDPEPRRGGRSKKVFRLEASGVRALERTAAVLNASGALQTEKEESTYGKTSPA